MNNFVLHEQGSDGQPAQALPFSAYKFLSIPVSENHAPETMPQRSALTSENDFDATRLDGYASAPPAVQRLLQLEAQRARNSFMAAPTHQYLPPAINGNAHEYEHEEQFSSGDSFSEDLSASLYSELDRASAEAAIWDREYVHGLEKRIRRMKRCQYVLFGALGALTAVLAKIVVQGRSK